jgi:hypothetical protein
MIPDHCRCLDIIVASLPLTDLSAMGSTYERPDLRNAERSSLRLLLPRLVHSVCFRIRFQLPPVQIQVHRVFIAAPHPKPARASYVRLCCHSQRCVLIFGSTTHHWLSVRVLHGPAVMLWIPLCDAGFPVIRMSWYSFVFFFLFPRTTTEL